MQMKVCTDAIASGENVCPKDDFVSKKGLNLP
jgi:hypothetical protein